MSEIDANCQEFLCYLPHSPTVIMGPKFHLLFSKKKCPLIDWLMTGGSFQLITSALMIEALECQEFGLDELITGRKRRSFSGHCCRFVRVDKLCKVKQLML